MTTGIRIEPDALLDVRRELLRRGLSLSEVVVRPPDTGSTSVLTAMALAQVDARVETTIMDLADLADGVQRLVDDLSDLDAVVRTAFDVLRRLLL